MAAIILHASVGDIEHVLVDGEFRKRDKKLVIDGYADVQARFLESAKRIQAIIKATPLPSQDQALPGEVPGLVPQLDAKRDDGTGYGPSFV